MLCNTCKMDIPASFKHAISKNECPSCGEVLIDEEMMAIIEEVGKTISLEATLREETVKKLATAIVTQYSVSLIDTTETNIPKRKEAKQKSIQHKIAPPSTSKQIEHADIVEVSDVDSKEISEQERENIMEEAIKKRYNMVDQTVDVLTNELDNELDSELIPPEIDNMSNGLFGDPNNILEKERMLRLAKQQQAMSSGSGFVRRSR